MMRRRPAEPIIPVEVLLRAYCSGVFPMANSATGKINWYSADPRGIINLDEFHIPGRLRRSLRSQPFEIRIDTAFEEVVRGCADRSDTWISPAIRRSYENLHRAGFAHSVESWREDRLEGGLYGVAFRGAFFGESMFHDASDASKAALIALVERLRTRGYRLLDTQMVTPLTDQFGATTISERKYQERLRDALGVECEFGEGLLHIHKPDQ